MYFTSDYKIFYFNSMIVRLKARRGLYIDRRVFDFNSMIVRLKALKNHPSHHRPCDFNSMIVRLKAEITFTMRAAGSFISIL